MSIDNSHNNHAWNKLPTTILRTLFHHVGQSNMLWLQNNASMFHACQLVCKNWEETAQEALYSQVHLGSNTLKFITTLIERKQLGRLVKTIIVLEDFSECGHVHELLEVIVNICPQIQEIYALQDRMQNEVWAYLGSAKVVPQGLKLFTTMTSDAVTRPLYASIAMRFENTLTQLQLCMNAGFFINSVEQGLQRLLQRRLTHFTSLQYLRVDHWKLNKIQDFDRLLDSCSRTTYQLSFIHLDLSHCIFAPTVIIKQNTTVRRLKICLSDIPVLMLKYLGYKLEGLQSFDGAFITYPTGVKQNIVDWWHQLTKICIKTKAYTLKFVNSNFTDSQLKNCIDFSRSTATQSENIKGRLSRLTLNKSQRDGNSIALSRTWDAQTLFVDFDSVSYIDTHLERLSLYSPHQIHAKVESTEELSTLIMLTAQEDVSKRKLLAETCNTDNMLVFFNVISLVSQINNEAAAAAVVVHFDSIVLCDDRPLLMECNHPMINVSELCFTNSILHHSVWSPMSKRFSTINTLKIDTCCILMEKPFCIELFLPFTGMTSLEIDIHPFVNATPWPSQKKMTKHAHCSLENRELLRAVTEEGHFMVKIETDDQTRVFYKQGLGGIKDWKINPEHVTGNPYTFVIWIKCKQLDEIKLLAENGLMWRMKLH